MACPRSKRTGLYEPGQDGTDDLAHQRRRPDGETQESVVLRNISQVDLHRCAIYRSHDDEIDQGGGHKTQCDHKEHHSKDHLHNESLTKVLDDAPGPH